MTHDRRHEITALILEVFAQARAAERPRTSAYKHPVAYGKMVMKLQERSDVAVEEIDHVLVQLCTRTVVNLIAGECFFVGSARIGDRELRPDDPIDADKIDWLYGSGRYAR